MPGTTAQPSQTLHPTAGCMNSHLVFKEDFAQLLAVDSCRGNEREEPLKNGACFLEQWSFWDSARAQLRYLTRASIKLLTWSPKAWLMLQEEYGPTASFIMQLTKERHTTTLPTHLTSIHDSTREACTQRLDCCTAWCIQAMDDLVY